jgi:hypothetical protein
MKYRYRAVERFWTCFYRLPPSQKESTRKAWLIFKEDPFDPRLRTHKIQRLLQLTDEQFMRLKLRVTFASAFLPG